MIMDMDEVRLRQRPAVDLIRRLAGDSPRLSEMVEEHVADNGEILSTLVLSDLARWYVESYVDRHDDPSRYAEAQAVVDRLGQAYETAEGDLANTVAVGFVEALIPDDGSWPEYGESLPTSLRDELVAMTGWRPR
jgi:hypothetical protein